jgi:hypothetical protein
MRLQVVELYQDDALRYHWHYEMSITTTRTSRFPTTGAYLGPDKRPCNLISDDGPGGCRSRLAIEIRASFSFILLIPSRIWAMSLLSVSQQVTMERLAAV